MGICLYCAAEQAELLLFGFFFFIIYLFLEKELIYSGVLIIYIFGKCLYGFYYKFKSLCRHYLNSNMPMKQTAEEFVMPVYRWSSCI